MSYAIGIAIGTWSYYAAFDGHIGFSVGATFGAFTVALLAKVKS